MSTSNVIVELQRSVRDLSQAVGRVEGKIDAFIDQMAVQDKRTTDLEVRTRKVENRQHWYAGAATIVGGIIGRFIPSLVPHA